MTPTTYLVGHELEVCYNGVSTPCGMIQSVEITPSQETSEVRSLCGLEYTKKKTPSIEVKAVFLYRNIELLAALFPNYFVAGAGAGDCGGLAIGSTSCSTGSSTGAPLNIHPICRTDACNDITLWNADAKLDFTITINEDDPESIEVTFTALPAPALLSGGGANPHAGEVFWVGTPGLANGVSFDCTTGDFV